MTVPLQTLAWRQGGRPRIAVAILYSWVLVASGLFVVLLIQGVSLNALSYFSFPFIATTSLALVWYGYATSSGAVLRAALRRSGVDPRLRERWSLIVSFLEAYGHHDAPKGMFGFAWAITLASASLLAVGLALPFVRGSASAPGTLSPLAIGWGVANLGFSVVLHAIVLHRWNGTAREIEARGFPLLGFTSSGAYGMGRIRGIASPKEMTRLVAMTIEDTTGGCLTRSLYETPQGTYRMHVVEEDGTAYFVPPAALGEAPAIGADEAARRWSALWAEAERLRQFSRSPSVEARASIFD
jgi:hypothetical protein